MPARLGPMAIITAFISPAKIQFRQMNQRDFWDANVIQRVLSFEIIFIAFVWFHGVCRYIPGKTDV
jgi:hypothetical protein